MDQDWEKEIKVREIEIKVKENGSRKKIKEKGEIFTVEGKGTDVGKKD